MDIRTEILTTLSCLSILAISNIVCHFLSIIFPSLSIFSIALSIGIYVISDQYTKFYKDFPITKVNIVSNNNDTTLPKPTIAVLEAFTKCNPIMSNNSIPNNEEGNIILPKHVNVTLMDGFSFNLKMSEKVYKIGPINNSYLSADNIESKKVLVKKGTSYFSAGDDDKFSQNTVNDEYCYLELGSYIKLLEGTLFNDGTNELKFAKDTMVKVL